MLPSRDINNNTFSKLYQNKVFFYFVLVLGILLIVLKLPMASVFYETVCTLITFAPMVVILTMAAIAYVQSKRYPDYQSIIRKFYLLFTLKFLAVIFVFYIFYAPTLFTGPIHAFFKYFRTLLTLEGIFFFLSYILTLVIAGTVIFVCFRLYQKSQGKYLGSITLLTRRTLYALFTFCFLILASSVAAYPQAYKPLTDTLGDAIYTASSGSIQMFKGSDPLAYNKLQSLGDFTAKLSKSISQTSKNITENNQEFADNLDTVSQELKTSITQTSKDLNDKIKDDLTGKVSIDGDTIEGALILSGSDADLTVEGTTTTKDIVPDSTLSYNLGEAGKSWNIIYAHRLIGASPIFIGNNNSQKGLTNDGDLVVTNDAEIQNILYAKTLTIGGAYTLPAADGSANQLLKTDGSGTLSWVAQVAPGGTAGQIQFNSGGTFAGDTALFWDNSTKRLGINKSNPATELEVGGTVKATAFMLPGGIYLNSDTVSTNYWAEDAGNIFRETGNVGLGNNTPLETLDITGRIRLRPTTAPVTTTDRLYNVTGDLFWNGRQLLAYDAATSNVTVTGTVSATNFFDSANSVYLIADSINGNYWGESGGNIYRETGNVSIGTNNANGYKLYVDGTLYGASSLTLGGNLQMGGNTIHGATTASGTLTLSSTTDATKGKILFGTSAYDEVNNRLGVGTTSPSYPLHVTGYSYLVGNAFVGNGGYFGFGGSDTSIYGTSANGTEYMSFKTDGSEWMRIINTGKVGIGTTSPVAKFQITVPDNTVVPFRFQTNTASPGPADALFAEFYGPSTRRAWYGFGTSNNPNFTFSNEMTNGDITFTPARYSLFSQGNVGIGTTSPKSLLHLRGGGSSLYDPTVYNSGLFFENNGSSPGYFIFQLANSTKNSFNVTNSGQTFIYSDAAFLGYGSNQTTTASGKGQLALMYDATHWGNFFVNSTGDLNITATRYINLLLGNVGINTTAPDGKLTIKGAGTTTGIAFNTKDSADHQNLAVLDDGTIQSTPTDSSALTDLLINPATKTSGNLMDLQINGSSMFRVNNIGSVSTYSLSIANGITSGNDGFYIGKSGGTNPRIRFYDEKASFTGTSIVASGQLNYFSINPTYNQPSATTANTDLLINRTQTAVGSGAQLLIDAQVGGVSKFKVDNTGKITTPSWLAVGGGTTFSSTAITPTSDVPTFTFKQYGDRATASPVWVIGTYDSNQKLTGGAGINQVFASVLPIYNQTGTAGGTDLLINRTETAVGSGTQLLIDAQVGGVSKFKIDNAGSITAYNGTFGNQVYSGYYQSSTSSSSLILSNRNRSDANLFDITMASGTYSQTSGTGGAVKISPTYNQVSGTAANTDLLINRTQTAIGSGAQLLIDAQVGGVSKFKVDNTGYTTWLGQGIKLPVGSASAGNFSLNISEGTYYSGLLETLPGQANSGWDFYVGGAKQATIGNGGIASNGFRRMAANTAFTVQTDNGTNSIGMDITYTANHTKNSGTFNLVNIGSTYSMMGTGGTFRQLAITPTYNQASGTAANTDLLINRTETAVGSGAQLLIDAQVGGVSKFKLSNAGEISITPADSSALTDLLINPTTKTSGNLIEGKIGSTSYFRYDAASSILWVTGQVVASSILKAPVLSTASTSTPISLTPFGSGSYASGSNVNAATIGGASTNAATAGTHSWLYVKPIYNQSAATGIINTDLLINRTETSLGTTPGAQLLIDAQVGGVSKFSVNNTGTVQSLYHYATGAVWTPAIYPGGNNSQFTVQSRDMSTNAVAVLLGSGTYSQTSGTNNVLKIAPIYNQTSGTAANTDLLINRTETAVGSGQQNLIDAQVGGVSKFRVDNTGNIFSAGTQLAVPDYVFEPDYNLLTIPELQSYILTNKHLPGIPSEAEIQKNGLNYSAMMMGLLQKVEENTLYTIDNSNQLSNVNGQLSNVILQTDQNITTVSELQTSVDTQLGVVEKQLTIDNEQLTDQETRVKTLEGQMSNVNGQVSNLEDLTVQLQAQIDELKTQIATPVDVAQIDLNKDGLEYLNQLLGVDTNKPGDISIIGQLTAKKVVVDGVETGAITISVIDKDAPTIGEATIMAGDSFVIVKTKAVTGESKVFVTFTDDLKGKSFYATDKIESESFKIKLSDAADADLQFDWWIVEQK